MRTIGLVAVTALLVGAVSAEATRMITGKQIKDGTITKADLAKPLRAKLTARAAPRQPMQRGADGAPGTPGAPGPTGPIGPVQVFPSCDGLLAAMEGLAEHANAQGDDALLAVVEGVVVEVAAQCRAAAP